jgi:ribosomal protein S18 acetylase RimI-like enzyme
MEYKQAGVADATGLAAIRADEKNLDYWIYRISGYMNGELHPRQALLPRIIYKAVDDDKIVGFVAGHLTKRYECDGELQWIDVIPAYKRQGIATQLLKLIAAWFGEQNAKKICVDVGSDEGKAFYRRHGAEELNEHWMVWKDIATLG